MSENAYEIHQETRDSRWLITCDHASNHVPAWVNGGNLGLPDEDMQRHIAYDVGAAGLSRHLADALDCTAILSCFSRLVIDPNRGPDDPTLMRKIYDGSIIPGNRYANDVDLQKRKDFLYHPYHTALEDLASKRNDTIVCAVHSFTPQLKGHTRRPWEVGVLYADDTRLAAPFIDRSREAGWTVGDNQPYVGYLPQDSIDQHTREQNRPNVLIEIRNDLIGDTAGQKEWAKMLAPVLQQALNDTGL